MQRWVQVRETVMKVLYILNDGPKALADRIMEAQSKENELEVIDLSKDDVSYETVVDSIFDCDKVISW
jgi:hypothetical protein